MDKKNSLSHFSEHKMVQVFKEWEKFTSILVLITILNTRKKYFS